MQRGLVLLALRQVAGSTAQLADVAHGARAYAQADDTVTSGLEQLRADLKACRERSLGLIERLEREGDNRETATP